MLCMTLGGVPIFFYSINTKHRGRVYTLTKHRGRVYTLDNKGWADLLDVLNLSTYFSFTSRKFNGLITRHGCAHSGIGKEIRKI